jgi:hypothetical protein
MLNPTMNLNHAVKVLAEKKLNMLKLALTNQQPMHSPSALVAVAELRKGHKLLVFTDETSSR